MRIIVLNDGETWTTSEKTIMVNVTDLAGQTPELEDSDIRAIYQRLVATNPKDAGWYSEENNLIVDVIARF